MDIAVQGASADVKAMLLDAIVAVQAASASGHEAAAKVADMASNPELKQALEQGSKYAETWRERLGQAAQAAGGGGQVSTAGNPIIDAIQQAGGKIMHNATDPVARDLGIIASGQLALHYYIAAFGTMSAYAKMLELPEVGQSLHECLEEAKRGDERYTELAAAIAR